MKATKIGFIPLEIFSTSKRDAYSTFFLTGFLLIAAIAIIAGCFGKETQIPKEKIDDFSIHQVPSSNLLKELQDLCSVKVRIMACQTKTIPETIQSGLSKPVKKAVRLMAKKIAEEYF